MSYMLVCLHLFVCTLTACLSVHDRVCTCLCISVTACLCVHVSVSACMCVCVYTLVCLSVPVSALVLLAVAAGILHQQPRDRSLLHPSTHCCRHAAFSDPPCPWPGLTSWHCCLSPNTLVIVVYPEVEFKVPSSCNESPLTVLWTETPSVIRPSWRGDERPLRVPPGNWWL